MEGLHLFSELINLFIYSTNIGGDLYYLLGTMVGPVDKDKTDMMPSWSLLSVGEIKQIITQVTLSCNYKTCSG